MTTEIGSLAVSLSLDASNFNGSMAQVDRNLRSMGSELKAVKAKGVDYGKSLDGLKSKKDVLSRSVEAANIKLTETRKKYDELVASGNANEAQLERQAKKVNDAQAQYNRLESELNDVNEQLRVQSSSWTQLSQRLAPVGEKFTAIGQKMTSVGQNLTAKVTAPILGLGAAAFKAAVDFESAFAGVKKTVDTSEEGFKKLEKGIRDMAKELPASASDIAAVAESAGQLGIAEDKILSFSRTVIDLGESTNLTREQAATEFARFANIVGMSQDNFDRLGSSIVGLGNTMATTESEIMSMGMRLAAQGAQVGMSEAQIMALAGTMSSLGIQAEMGGTAMTTILKKIQSAVASGGNDLNAFAKAAGMTGSEFKKAFETDAVTALDALVKGLNKSSGEGKNLTDILKDLGIKGIYESDVLLRMAGASDLLSSAVNTSTKAWDENNALTNEAKQRYETTASQIKILWNNVKDLGIEMGGQLIPIVMDGVNKIKPLVKSFGEMDDKTKKMILTVGGLVAAAGPLLVVGGSIMSGIGGTITAVSTLTGAIGAGGGLAATLTALSGPIGLTVAGVGLLAGGIIAVKQATEEAKVVNLEHAESLISQQTELSGLTEKYNELADKNRLTNDELLKYRDLQSKIQMETDPSKIENLTSVMKLLQERSGLTNDEINTMLRLNDDIIKTAPEVDQAYSDRGNAIISNKDALDEVNGRLRESIQLELENQRIKNEANLDTNIQKHIRALDELKAKEAERDESVKKRDELEQSIFDLKIEKQAKLNAGEEVAAGWVQDQINDQQALLLIQNDKVSKLADEVIKKQESKDATQEEIDKTQQLYEKMINLQLAQVGINTEGAAGVAQLDQSITKTQGRIQTLMLLSQNQGGLNDQQKEELGLLNDQLRNHQEARSEIRGMQGEQAGVNQKIKEGTGEAKNMTNELDKDVKKDVDVDDKGKAKEITDEAKKSAEKPITFKGQNSIWDLIPKTLSVAVSFLGGKIPGNANGTKDWSGGLSWVGEAGRELTYLPGSKGLALVSGPSLLNLPRGAKVVPNRDTEAILSKWNVPAFANGTRYAPGGLSLVGEAGREIVDFGGSGGTTTSEAIKLLRQIAQNQKGDIVIENPIVLDGREVARGTYRYISDFQGFDAMRTRRFDGSPL